MIAWLLLAVAGVATFAIGATVNPVQAYASYLTAYIYGLGIVLGALFLILIEQLIASTWFVVVRRAAETIASALPMFVPLFVPIALGAHWLYPWTNLASLDAHARGLVSPVTAYLNLPFFFIRAGVYFVCWIWIEELVRAWSLRQDRDPNGAWSARIRSLSAPALILLAFTLELASVDWLMSLVPGWFSTMFGVQIFASAMLGALALMAVLLGRTANPELAAATTTEHDAAIGKMILTFTIFWAYTTFMQLLIVWIADLPDEASWYIHRTTGAWLGVGLALGAAEFGVPFFLMLSHALKRRGRVIAMLGGWLLAARYAEMYWVVLPQFHPSSARPHWLDASAAATVVGAAVAFALWRARGHAAVPIGDPELPTSLRYSET